jgi:cystathionine beta-lyase
LSASFAIVQNPVLRKTIEKVKEGSVGFINIMGLAAMEAAYRIGEPWLDELLIYLEQNRDFIASYMQQNLAGVVGYTPPEGTYLAWLDFSQTGLEKPGEFLKCNSHVVVNEGRGFGTGGEQFVRLNFGCPRSLLKEGLDRIAAAITTSVYS